MIRTSTRGAMISALQALDDRASFHADIHAGVAAGLAVSGLTSDAIEAAIHHDRGEWLIDRDGRKIWAPTR